MVYSSGHAVIRHSTVVYLSTMEMEKDRSHFTGFLHLGRVGCQFRGLCDLQFPTYSDAKSNVIEFFVGLKKIYILEFYFEITKARNDEVHYALHE